MRKNPLGDILYFVIEKIVNKGLSKIEIENNNTNDNKIDLSNSNNKNRLFTVSERVKNASKSALKSIIAILKIIGIAVIILGTILLLILFLIFYITK
jgi:beta-lactamase regulating signal transducer with metallopeptidase domain